MNLVSHFHVIDKYCYGDFYFFFFFTCRDPTYWHRPCPIQWHHVQDVAIHIMWIYYDMCWSGAVVF